MRSFARTLSFACLALPALAACGDDNTPTNPDTGPTFKGFDANEGGEVRVEYIWTPLGNLTARATAFFFKDAGSKKFFPYPNLNGCTDVTGDLNWPTATNPIGERVYYDVGDVVVSGGQQPLMIPRNANMGNDPFGRTHPAGQWYFRPLKNPNPATELTDGPTYLPPNRAFTVQLTGSAGFPARSFQNVLFMPQAYDLIPPPPAATPPSMARPLPSTALAAGQDLTFTWQKVAASAPSEYQVQSLVAFTGANGPVVLCIEPDDGSITVPGSLVNVARAAYPAGGFIARQTLTHVVRELEDADGPTGKRIDFISVWCYQSAFSVP